MLEEMGKKINDSLGGNSPSGRIFLDDFFHVGHTRVSTACFG